jgi:hypothetical protein
LKAKGREIQGKDPLPKIEFQEKVLHKNGEFIITIKVTKVEYEIIESLRKYKEKIKDVMIDGVKIKHAQVNNPRKQKKMLINKRTIPADVKGAAFEKSEGRCSNCQTMKNLEYDHRIPFALGGKSDKENIRLLCKNCNLRARKNDIK